MGFGGSLRVQALAGSSGIARQARAPRRLLAPAVLPVSARAVGTFLRADRDAAIRGQWTDAAARETAVRRRRACMAGATVRTGCDRSRARVRTARPQAAEPAARRVGLQLRAFLRFELGRLLRSCP